MNIGISGSKKHHGEDNSRPACDDQYEVNFIDPSAELVYVDIVDGHASISPAHHLPGGDIAAEGQLSFPSQVGAPFYAQDAVESVEQLALVSQHPSTSTHSRVPLRTHHDVPQYHHGVPQYHHNGVPQYLRHGVSQQPHYGGFGEIGGSSPAAFAYYQHQHTVASSSLNSALAATGTMIGNIAKGLLEGAGPVINNLVAQHKVSHW